MSSKLAYVAVSSDVVHEGILNVLARAMELADEVVVGVLADAAIAAYKRPRLLPLESRLRVFASLRGVTRVVVQREASYAHVLRELRPDFVVHGDDWCVGAESVVRAEVVSVLAEWGGGLVEVPHVRGLSASRLDDGLDRLVRSPDDRRASLRRLVSAGAGVRAIETSCGLAALVAADAAFEDKATGERRTFDACWISSLGDSLMRGKPDIELVDFSRRLETAEQVMDVCDMPLIFDADTGGTAEQLAHNVLTLERVGVSCAIVEDKCGQKRNSLLGTTVEQRLADPVEFADKLAFAKSRLRTRDFMVVARVESLIAGAGMADALGRARTYVERGGADGIMIHSCSRSADEVLEFAHEFRRDFPDVALVCVPTTYDMAFDDDLFAAGFDIVIYANQMVRAAYKAYQTVANMILTYGRAAETGTSGVCESVAEVLSLV